MSWGIYKFENNINGLIYIGQAFDLEERYKKHFTNAEYDLNHKEDFYIALREFGWNNFSYEILEKFDGKPNRNILNELETYWISYYDSYNNGYNMTPGGSNGPYINLCKNIEQYDLEGNFVATYKSAHEAARMTKIDFSTICAAARGDRNHTGYYQWKYVDDNKKIKNIKNDIIIIERPICKYDLNYNLIEEYSSLKEAVEKNNSIHKSSICNCCQGKNHTAGGYIWRYKDNFFIEEPKKKNNTKYIIKQFDKNNNFIAEYSSALEASKKTNISNSSIGLACQGKRKTAGNYIWKKELKNN